MEETRDFSVFSPIFFHFFEGNALSPLYKPLHFDYNTDILMSGGNSVKEEIYTIPVMDGFKAGTECPFCSAPRLSLPRLLERSSGQWI